MVPQNPIPPYPIFYGFLSKIPTVPPYPLCPNPANLWLGGVWGGSEGFGIQGGGRSNFSYKFPTPLPRAAIKFDWDSLPPYPQKTSTKMMYPTYPVSRWNPAVWWLKWGCGEKNNNNKDKKCERHWCKYICCGGTRIEMIEKISLLQVLHKTVPVASK